MVALTVNWSKVAMYAAVCVVFLMAGGACVALFLLGAVVAYAALCMGLKAAAAVVFGLALFPLVGLVLLSTAFWQDHRQQRMRAAFGGPGL